MKTTIEATERIGQVAKLRVLPGMMAFVNVVDSRQVFGRLDFKIEPVSGVGAAWVAASSLSFEIKGE